MAYYCQWVDTGETYLSDVREFPGYEAFQATVAPQDVAEMQFATFRQQLSKPTIRSWPALDRLVVGVETWFRVDTYAPKDDPFDELGVSGNLHAEPTKLEFVVDGEVVKTCRSAGRVWEDHFDGDTHRTDCGHAFHRAQPDGTGLTVRVTYGVSWTASTGDGGLLGEVVMAESFPMQVRGYQAVIR